MIEIMDACNALIDGKIVIAYFGDNDDYKFNHLAAPVEIRLLGDYFSTYTSHGGNCTKLREGDVLDVLQEKFNHLDIYPVCLLDIRPINEPSISR